MRTRYRFAIIGLILAGLVAFSWQVGHSQSNDIEYFSETRHFVEGNFYHFYNEVPNPEFVYGYPLTEAFVNADGVRVQYFHRARFEQLPNGEIVRTPIGSLLYEPGRQPFDQDVNAATCRGFATGFLVCMDFLSFFDRHGGLSQFGLPISPSEYDGIRVVQYFEFARLEWYPEMNEPGLQVRFTDIGKLYFHHVGENQARFNPFVALNIIDVTSLRVHAFPSNTKATSGDNLSVYVIVQDQAYTGVKDVAVEVLIEDEAGKQTLLTGLTNEFGYVEIPLSLLQESIASGKAIVQASASFAGLNNSTRTSFSVAP